VRFAAVGAWVRFINEAAFAADLAGLRFADEVAFAADLAELRFANAVAFEADFAGLRLADELAFEVDFAGPRFADEVPLEADFAAPRFVDEVPLEADFAAPRFVDEVRFEADFAELRFVDEVPLEADFAGPRFVDEVPLDPDFAGPRFFDELPFEPVFLEAAVVSSAAPRRALPVVRDFDVVLLGDLAISNSLRLYSYDHRLLRASGDEDHDVKLGAMCTVADHLRLVETNLHAPTGDLWPGDFGEVLDRVRYLTRDQRSELGALISGSLRARQHECPVPAPTRAGCVNPSKAHMDDLRQEHILIVAGRRLPTRNNLLDRV
jgi:hypothetical protein